MSHSEPTEHDLGDAPSTPSPHYANASDYPDIIHLLEHPVTIVGRQSIPDARAVVSLTDYPKETQHAQVVGLMGSSSAVPRACKPTQQNWQIHPQVDQSINYNWEINPQSGQQGHSVSSNRPEIILGQPDHQVSEPSVVIPVPEPEQVDYSGGSNLKEVLALLHTIEDRMVVLENNG